MSQELIFRSSTDSLSSFSQVAPDDLNSSHFSKLLLKSEVIQTVSEHTPQVTFSKFLETKADPKNGFGIKDHLKYRYIEYVTAEGLWNRIKAFMSLGGLGYFFADTVDATNKEAFKKECEFYNQCCKVQACYLKFSKKPEENFKAMQEAYEAILVMAENNNSKHDQINTILNMGLSNEDHIGAAILKHIATNEFAPKGKFTVESIHDTISGQEFLANIQSKYDQGYRGTIREDEASVYQQAEMRGKIQQSEIKSILDKEGTRAIFTSYARAYNEQLNPKNLKNIEVSINICDYLSDNKNIREGHIDKKIDDYNQLIFNLIQDPDLIVPMAVLPPTFQSEKFVDELDEITSIYQSYQSDIDSLPQLNLDIEEASDAFNKAESHFEAEKKKTKMCTLDELSNVFGEAPNLSLPLARRCLDEMQEKGQYAEALAQVNKEISKKISELSGCVGKKGTTTILVHRLESEVKEALKEVSKNGQLYEQALKAMPSAKNLNTPNSDLEKAMNGLETAISNCKKSDKKLEDAKQNLKKITEQLAIEKAELKSLSDSDPKYELIKKRNECSQMVEEKAKIVFKLSYENILVISSDEKTKPNEAFKYIESQLIESRNQCHTYQQKKLNGMNTRSEIYNRTQRTLKKLKEFGIQMNEYGNIVGVKFGGFNNEKYREEIKKELEKQGPLSANIIDALRITALPIDMVNKMQSIGKTSDSKSEILLSTSKTKVDPNKPIVRNRVKHQINNMVKIDFVIDEE